MVAISPIYRLVISHLYIHVFAMLVAQLCHHSGTTLPRPWHDCANAVARSWQSFTVSAIRHPGRLKLQGSKMIRQEEYTLFS
ncbi:hypothetical protein [Bacteroides intestinalis]|uniref:hypothetical protein n=1 Tax=Bacteroides intestinalis TaxID=329854 RepID=UPI000AA0478C|nr:hypothetical protein [Bacteroides intestinalis]